MYKVRCSKVLYSTAQCYTVQYCVVQYSIVQYITGYIVSYKVQLELNILYEFKFIIANKIFVASSQPILSTFM